MSIRYKSGIMEALKEKGYSSYKLRHSGLLGEKTMQEIRNQAEIPNKTLNRICQILDCKISDVIEYIPDPPEKPQS